MEKAVKATAKVLPVKPGSLPIEEMFAFVQDHGDCMDVTLTDARAAWRVEGWVPDGNLFVSSSMAMEKAREALCLSDADTTFDFILQQCGKDWVLRWIWRPHDSDARLTGNVTLAPVEDAVAVLRTEMKRLVLSSGKFQGACSTLEADCAELDTQLQHLRSEMQRHISEKQQREKELFVSFAELLNEKKNQLRKLKEEVEGLHDQLANQQGAHETPEHTDDADDAVYEADTEEPDEDSAAETAQRTDAPGDPDASVRAGAAGPSREGGVVAVAPGSAPIDLAGSSGRGSPGVEGGDMPDGEATQPLPVEALAAALRRVAQGNLQPGAEAAAGPGCAAGTSSAGGGGPEVVGGGDGGPSADAAPQQAMAGSQEGARVPAAAAVPERVEVRARKRRR